MLRNTAMVAVFSLLLSPAAMLAGKKQSLPAGQQAGVISAILRNATLTRPSQSDPQADYGTQLAWTDTLRTDGNGRVRVMLANNAILSMGSNSEIVFNERRGETTSLTLTYGQMRIQPDNAGTFEIRTSNALISATGADFAIDASVPERLRIICLKGSVQVARPDGAAGSQCDAGEIVVVKAGNAPYQPQLADATTLGIARNITDPEEQPPVQYFP